MRTNHAWKVALAAVVVFAWMVSPGSGYSQQRLEDVSKPTLVTFAEPVAIGDTVLPAGAYLIKLVEFLGDRHVVRVTSTDEMTVYATLIGHGAYRSRWDRKWEKTEITFYEAAPGRPAAIETWFYRGNVSGIHFSPPTR